MERKWQAAETNIASDVEDTQVLMASYIKDKTSQGKSWIFDSGSTVHVCSQKEFFNSLVVKEEMDCQDGGWLSLREH